MISSEDDPRPTRYPGQGDIARAGAWFFVSFFGGGLTFFFGLLILLSASRPGPTATAGAILMLVVLPVTLVFTVREFRRALRSNDVYTPSVDGARTAAELHGWEEREAARQAARDQSEDGGSDDRTEP